MELTTGRSPATSGDLAFALRLKPLAAAAPLATASSSETPARELGLKSGAISLDAPETVAATRADREAGPDSGHAHEDSRQAEDPASRKTNYPERPEKYEHAEEVEPRVPTESAPAQAPGGKPQATPHVQVPASPVSPDVPLPPKAAAMPAASTAAAPLDKEDALIKAPPTREISLQVSDSGDRKVDVRLVERAGEVLVSVRTPDEPLAREMRQELGSLTGKLAQSGYETEQFTPHSAGSSNLSNQRNSSENQDFSHGGRGETNQGGSGRQQQPHDERGKRPAWMDEMEDSLARRQNNRSTAWLLNR